VLEPQPAPEPPVVEEPTPEPPPAAELQVREEAAPRQDAAREPSASNPQTPTSSITVSEPLASAPAPLPPAAPGEDWAWTDKGDAFVFGTGGSGDGGEGVVLGSFTRFASIASAAARIHSLGVQQRVVRNTASNGAGDAGLVLVDSTGNTMLFFNLFGGGGGGGAALVLLTALGMLAVFRMMPPDWHSALRNSTAVWRPSAYVPPIEHPG
jgi:hypothetical protein